MARAHSLQDGFLESLRKDGIPVSILLLNGIRLQGRIDSFDQFVVSLKNITTQAVYKHTISTVVPFRPVEARRPQKLSERPQVSRNTQGITHREWT